MISLSDAPKHRFVSALNNRIAIVVGYVDRVERREADGTMFGMTR